MSGADWLWLDKIQSNMRVFDFVMMTILEKILRC